MIYKLNAPARQKKKIMSNKKGKVGSTAMISEAADLC